MGQVGALLRELKFPTHRCEQQGHGRGDNEGQYQGAKCVSKTVGSAELVAQLWRLFGGHLDFEFGNSLVEIGDTSCLLPVTESPHADLGDLLLTDAGPARVDLEVWQRLTVLGQQLAQSLRQPASLRGRLDVLVIRRDTLSKLLGLSLLLVKRVEPGRLCVQVIGERRVLIGKADEQRVQACGFALPRLRLDL